MGGMKLGEAPPWMDPNQSLASKSVFDPRQQYASALGFDPSLINPVDVIRNARTPQMPGQSQTFEKIKFQECLMTRMRIKDGDKINMDFLDFHVGGNAVHVFVVKNDKSVVIEDDKDLFPSDKLITELRMLMG